MRVLPNNWMNTEEWIRWTLHINARRVLFSSSVSCTALSEPSAIADILRSQLSWVILKLEGKRNLRCANIVLFNSFADDFITLRHHGFCLLFLCHFSVIVFLTQTHPEGRTYWYLVGNFSEKAMATHSSTLTWKIPWTEKPRRLQSMGSQRVGHDWATSL